jgi:hypothetical protein
MVRFLTECTIVERCPSCGGDEIFTNDEIEDLENEEDE